MFDENGATTTTTPLLDNTGGGCYGETERFCCCVDPAVRGPLQKPKAFIDSN
jgi:hypothetical protein